MSREELQDLAISFALGLSLFPLVVLYMVCAALAGAVHAFQKVIGEDTDEELDGGNASLSGSDAAGVRSAAGDSCARNDNGGET